jgi:hypothetical protein
LTFSGASNPASGASPPPPPKKTLKCKRGFVKKKVKNRETCVKKPKKTSKAKKPAKRRK